MRIYVNSTEGAITAVENIVALVRSGEVDPLISLDIETSPLRSLVGYPNTLTDAETGELVEPNKRLYLSYAQTAWRNNYNPARLTQLGVYLPTKLTAGNEAKGVPAREAWRQFLARIEELGHEALEPARWTATELAAQRGEAGADADRLSRDVAALGVQVAEKEAETSPKLRKGIGDLKKALKIATGELEAARARVKLLAGIDLAHPIDGRLLLHVVSIGVRGKFKIDPVKPGLDPHTSEIFLVQFTLRRKDDGSYLSWIFNSRLYDLKLLLPALRLSRQAKYIGANIKFDLAHLLLALGEAPQNVWCTRVASRMLYLGLKMPHSLAACTKRFAGIELSKEERNLFVGRWYTEPTPEMLRYAFTDTEVLFPVYDAQLAKAKAQEQTDLLDTFSRLSYPVAVRELLGMCIDAEKWLALAEEQTLRRDAVAAELEQLLLGDDYAKVFAPAGGPTDLAEDAEEASSDEDDDDSAQDTRPDAIIRISQRDLVIERLRALLGAPIFEATFPDGKVSLGKDARELMETKYIQMYGAPHPFFGLYRCPTT